MLTFNDLSFRHFVQEVNEIQYLRSLLIALTGYQISLTSCTKWWNDEQLKGKCFFFLFEINTRNYHYYYIIILIILIGLWSSILKWTSQRLKYHNFINLLGLPYYTHMYTQMNLFVLFLTMSYTIVSLKIIQTKLE